MRGETSIKDLLMDVAAAHHELGHRGVPRFAVLDQEGKEDPDLSIEGDRVVWCDGFGLVDVGSAVGRTRELSLVERIRKICR